MAKEEVGGVAEQALVQAKTIILQEERILKGRVPQAVDWLNVWAESTEQVSVRNQERICKNKAVSGKAAGICKTHRNQVRIVAKVVARKFRSSFG